MLIRSITQHSMDKKLASGSFLVLSTQKLHFHKKKLAVLDISMFTFCKVDYNVGFQRVPISGHPNFATRIDVGPVTISARHRNYIEPTWNRYRAAQMLNYVLM